MKTLREQVHQANIIRYQRLLACDLTPYERRYLERILEQERSAIMRLQSPPTASPHGEPRDHARWSRLLIMSIHLTDSTDIADARWMLLTR